MQGIPPHPSGHALAPEGVSGGKRRDLTCGHCCLKTSSWAEMCAHLNRPGMEQEDPYQPGSPLGEALLRLLPEPIPPPVSSPVSGDVDTAGVHDFASQGLHETPSTPPRGKAAKRRRVHCSPASVTSPPLAAPRVERDAAPRSSPEACLPFIFVAGSPVGAVMWTRTIWQG